jgi:K+-sensing histidine kinase KdpD
MGRYGLVLGIVAVTLALVDILGRVLGFPPLVLLFAPTALVLPLLGVGPGLAALVLSAVLGDCLFVEPVRQFTFHKEGFVLSLYLSAGGVFMHVVVLRRRKSLQPR